MQSPTVPRRAFSALLKGVLALVLCASTADPPGADGAAATAARGLLFQWARMARAHRHWFGPDRVHPSGAGYAARARGIAAVVRRCR